MIATNPVNLAHKVIEPSIRSKETDIILLHGLYSSKECFDDITVDLANKTGMRIYTVDIRNHGDSEWSDVFNFEAMKADVIHFMNDHRIKSAVLLGHSMGGRLAMIIALNRPDRVEKLILEDMTPKSIPSKIISDHIEVGKIMYHSINKIPHDTDYDGALSIITEYLAKNKPKGVVINSKVFRDKAPYLPLIQKNGKYIWKTNFATILKQKELGFCQKLEGLFKKPALFIYGTLSEFNVGNDEQFILRLFPLAKLHGLVASHSVHYECSEEFVQLVANFLQ